MVRQYINVNGKIVDTFKPGRPEVKHIPYLTTIIRCLFFEDIPNKEFMEKCRDIMKDSKELKVYKDLLESEGYTWDF